MGLREGSKNWAQAEAAGLTVKTVAEAAKWGDIVMMLINDEVQADVYKKDIAPYLEEGNALAFAHGFNIRYKQIVPPAGVDVFMAAPKGPGHTVRSTYVSGKGVPCLVAVEPAGPTRSRWPTSPVSAAPGQVSWRPPSTMRPRPISSASRPFCAAAWWI